MISVKTISKIFGAGTCIAMLSACSATSSQPLIYPDGQYRNRSSQAIESDKRYCMNLADEYANDESRYKAALKGGAIGGALGAGTGAVAGTITKSNVGRATGAGAAAGAILGIAKGLYDSGNKSPSYKQFVEHCLRKKGYDVAGWS